MSITPNVKWAQNLKQVFVTIELQKVDVNEAAVEVTENKIYFKGKGGLDQKTYEITLNLHATIKEDGSSQEVNEKGISFLLIKVEKNWWPNLAQEGKLKNIKVDWDKWKDEDDIEKERYAYRVKCTSGKYGYGKEDEDIRRVCVSSDCDTIEVYESDADSNDKTIIINKKDVVGFEFGAYYGKTIPGECRDGKNYGFLCGFTSLLTAPKIPEYVTSIGDYFLAGCTSLETPPVIPNSVRKIDNGFLSGCTKLIAPPPIPRSVTSVGDYFLYDCTGLKGYPVLPDSVTSIGSNYLSRSSPPSAPKS